MSETSSASYFERDPNKEALLAAYVKDFKQSVSSVANSYQKFELTDPASELALPKPYPHLLWEVMRGADGQLYEARVEIDRAPQVDFEYIETAQLRRLLTDEMLQVSLAELLLIYVDYNPDEGTEHLVREINRLGLLPAGISIFGVERLDEPDVVADEVLGLFSGAQVLTSTEKFDALAADMRAQQHLGYAMYGIAKALT